MSQIIILRGGPAVGKTTLAKALDNRLKRVAIVDQGIIRRMISSGCVSPNWGTHPGLNPEEYQKQCRMIDVMALEMARTLYDNGFTVVIPEFNGGESSETFILLSRPDHELVWYPTKEYLEMILGERRYIQIILDADRDTLLNRLVKRGIDERTIEFILLQRERFLQILEKGNVDYIMDTSRESPDVIAKKLIIEFGLS